MKTLLFFVILFIFTIADTPDAIGKKSKNNVIQANNYYVETIVLSSKSDDPTRFSYTYNSDGKILSEIKETFDGGDWEKYYRFTYSYNENDDILTFLAEIWNNNQWNDASKYTNDYDLNGYLVSYLNERWSDDQWENYSRRTVTNDENGNVLTDIKERWLNEAWKNHLRITNTYDEDDNLLTATSEAGSEDQWVNYGRTTMTYNSHKDILTVVHEDWETDAWVNDYKVTNIYNRSWQLTNFLREIWSSNNNDWANNWRTDYTYNADSQLLEKELHEWYYDGDWNNANLYTYRYDKNENMLNDLRQNWMDDDWQNQFRYTFSYDKNNNMTTLIHKSWDEDQWVESDQNIYFLVAEGEYTCQFRCYQLDVSWTFINSVIGLKEEINASSFPNPFSQLLITNYELLIPSNVTMKIYDAMGIEVAMPVNEFQDSGEHQVVFDGSSFTPGMYYYTIQIGNSVESGKMVLVR